MTGPQANAAAAEEKFHARLEDMLWLIHEVGEKDLYALWRVGWTRDAFRVALKRRGITPEEVGVDL